MASPILHISTVHCPLDTRIFYKEARALARRGFSVSLATTADAEDTVEGVRIIPLGRREGSRFRRIPRDLRALWIMLREREAIIHIHDPELLVMAIVPLALGRRIVYDVHEFYRQTLAVSAWIPGPLRRSISALYGAMEYLLAGRLAGIVVVSEEMLPMYRRFLPDKRVALVRNFPHLCDAEIEAARAAPAPLPGAYIIQTGGTDRLRVFDAIVTAAERLRELGQREPIVNLGRVDLSEYPQTVRISLLQRAKKAEVHVVGEVSYTESLRYMAHATVGYITMKDTDNYRRALPNKLFEYFVFGLPVVAPNFGIIADVVNSTGSGILVSPEAGKAHGEAFARLLRDRDLWETHAGASKRASLRYSFPNECDRLIDLYGRIDAKPRS